MAEAEEEAGRVQCCCSDLLQDCSSSLRLSWQDLVVGHLTFVFRRFERLADWWCLTVCQL